MPRYERPDRGLRGVTSPKMSRAHSSVLGVVLALAACTDDEAAGSATDADTRLGMSSSTTGALADETTGTTGASTGDTTGPPARVTGTGPFVDEDALQYPRVVAIGDLHGDLDNTKDALMLAGAIDETGAWIAGDQLAVIQVGDQIDRGFDNRPTMDYMRQLAAEAEAAGGVLHSLLGNHETENVRPGSAGYYLARYANEASLAQFEDIPWDEDYIAAWEREHGLPDLEDFEYLTYTEKDLRTTPDAWKGQLTAYHPGGPYAQYFAERKVILIFQRTLYVHGGVLPWHVEYGIDNINEDVRRWMLGETLEPYEIVSSSTDGPLWTRALSDDTSVPAGDRLENYCEVIDEVLEMLDVDRMVVGHSVRYDMAAECDNKLVIIDVGMSSFYLPFGGGEIKLLQIVDGDQLSVLQ